MSFGTPIDEREPFDTKIRTMALENHMIQDSLDRLRLVHGTLGKIFDGSKFDKESEISEKLSELSLKMDALNAKVKTLETVIAKSSDEQYERLKGHMQAVLRTVMEQVAADLQVTFDARFTRLEHELKNLDRDSDNPY